MGDSILDNQPNVLHGFGRNVLMNEELLGIQDNSTVGEEEMQYVNDLLQFSYKEHDNNPKSLLESIYCSELGENQNSVIESDESTENTESKPTQDSMKLIENLQKNDLNLLLLATSLSEDLIRKKLHESLDSDSFSLIPIPLDNNSKSKANSQIDVCLNLASLIDGKCKSKSNSRFLNLCAKQLKSKRKSESEKDEKYWKRRRSNNEAARRSREAKRARLCWIQDRTKELEVENELLREELLKLEEKVLAAENKKSS